MNKLIPKEIIENRILLIRNHKVMLDKDLSELYQIETSQLKRQVRRNIERFPSDFMFELTKEEFENLKCQFGISSWGGTRYVPMAFTEQGVAMLSSVLNSERAIKVNIEIMRAFTRLRKMITSYKNLVKKVEDIEKKYDKQFAVVFDALKQLIVQEEKPKRKIGFKQDG